MRMIGYTLAFLLVTGFTECRQIVVIPQADPVGRYGVYELTILPTQISVINPWEEVSVAARFTHRDGQTFDISGFYYRPGEWKARFSPPLTGEWRWSLSFVTAAQTRIASGAFYCEPSARLGFVQAHPTNPYRLVFANGSLFNAIGIGDCLLDVDQDGNPLNNWGLDGDFRRPRDPEYGRVVDMPVYMNAYGAGGAGFNLFRWSIDNCAFKLWDRIAVDGNRYRVAESMWGDALVEALRQNGFRIWLTFFNEPPFLDADRDVNQQAAIQRYLRYIVARYGAYVDIWELMNESNVSAAWIAFATDYLRSIDPYRRLIATSFERPELPGIDINAPHWYERESELESNEKTTQRILEAKRWGKPVIFGEQGNLTQNWDPRSALRMRIRSWTAFFEEGMLIFWNSSFAKDLISPGEAANLYIGPEERRYVRALQDFTANLDPNIEPFTLTPGGPGLRAFGLRSPRMILGYFHHFADHDNPVRTTVTVDLPARAVFSWINPATGYNLDSYSLDRGTHTLTTPIFIVDLALKIQF